MCPVARGPEIRAIIMSTVNHRLYYTLVPNSSSSGPYPEPPTGGQLVARQSVNGNRFTSTCFYLRLLRYRYLRTTNYPIAIIDGVRVREQNRGCPSGRCVPDLSGYSREVDIQAGVGAGSSAKIFEVTYGARGMWVSPPTPATPSRIGLSLLCTHKERHPNLVASPYPTAIYSTGTRRVCAYAALGAIAIDKVPAPFAPAS